MEGDWGCRLICVIWVPFFAADLFSIFRPILNVYSVAIFRFFNALYAEHMYVGLNFTGFIFCAALSSLLARVRVCVC